MEKITKQLADQLTDIALQQYKVAFDFKKGRLEEIRKNEEFYIGRKIKVPKGRFGVALPTMSGFVDDLMSKIDDSPSIKFGYKDIADMRLSQKISSAWEIDSHPNKANWPLKDRWAKKLAIFSGRAIYKVYAESEPNYKHYFEVVDHEDFLTEPLGGGNLEDHLFCGQDNIFKTKERVEANAEVGLYDRDQVKQLYERMGDEKFEKNDDIYKSKQERLSKLGLNLTNNEYVGTKVAKFVEWYMEHNGERYYILFDWFTKTWVRCAYLKELDESGLYPFTSWATHEDAFNFWSKAPCDDIRPIAESMDILFNQALENREKANWGQRAYDPAIFPDPSELEWRPNGLVIAKASAKGKNINQGIYEFRTPEITGTIDLIGWMKNFARAEAGVNPNETGAQSPQEEKVGIYFGKLQQMADRVGLHNKSYRESHLAAGLRYAYGLKQHLTEPILVKMIGENGIQWDELTKGEAQKSIELDLDISGGSAEVMANEAKTRSRAEALKAIMSNQNLSAQVNQNWLLGEVLKMGYEEADIRVAVSKDAGNLDMLSRASEAIQEIMAGKQPKPYRGATTVYIQKIVDFASDEVDLKDMELYNALMAFAKLHTKFAMENMVRTARIMAIQRATMNPGMPMQNISEGVSVPERNAGSPVPPGISGNRATNILQGKSNVEVA